MPKLLLLTLCCLCSSLVFAQQNSSYQDDLRSLFQTLQKTPSYKDQVTGNKKQEYQLLYEKLKMESVGPSAFDTLFKLSELLWPLKDNHLGFYQAPNQYFKSSMLSDTNQVKKYRESAYFKKYPIPGINLDSLEKQLSLKPLNSIEGIYFQGNRFRIGIYLPAGKDNLVGVMLSSDAQIWDRGEMVILLNQSGVNQYRGIYANLYNKDLFFVKSDKFNNGRLLLFGSKKEAPSVISNINAQKALFELNTIDKNIQYLRLGNFRTSNEALVQSEKFYSQVKDSLTSKNLIVDLRNNPGGGFKASGKFLSLLKEYSKRGKIYVMINNRTISNAEQFTLKLKGKDNITTLGETTNGTITYGSNYGKTETLPSGKYKLYPTDMRDTGNFLAYEEIGVVPDVLLDQKSDWIMQVVEYISRKK